MATLPKTILNTYHSLASTFTDFLVVAIHTILYERSLYRQETFLLTRAYNFPVRQNRHPKVCKWVLDSASAVHAQLLKGTVKRVAFVIYSQKLEILERFIFDVSRFPSVPEQETLTEFEGTSTEEGDDAEEFRISRVDVEEQLRATVRKLAYCGSKLGQLPNGCTYTIAVELKDQAEPPIRHPQPWVPSDPPLQAGQRGRSERIAKGHGGVKTVPVRAVETGEFIFESWIEEGKAKNTDG